VKRKRNAIAELFTVVGLNAGLGLVNLIAAQILAFGGVGRAP